MKTDKMVVAVMVASVLLLLLIGWAFYQTLQLNSEHKIKLGDYPQKAVMASATAMNEARLDKLAQSGKVVKGMSTEQVRLALGEPARIEQMERNGEKLTIWRHRGEGWMSIVFDSDGLVTAIEKQP